MRKDLFHDAAQVPSKARAPSVLAGRVRLDHAANAAALILALQRSIGNAAVATALGESTSRDCARAPLLIARSGKGVVPLQRQHGGAPPTTVIPTTTVVDASIQAGDWRQAAIVLNGTNDFYIHATVQRLSPSQRVSLKKAALTTAGHQLRRVAIAVDVVDLEAGAKANFELKQEHDQTILFIIAAYNYPATNLEDIKYDPSLEGTSDAVTDGPIGTGKPQWVYVGPRAFSRSYQYLVRVIGHELQHVQQKTGAEPITNSDVREFLSYSWEALDRSAPSLTPPERVTSAQAALGFYARFSPIEKKRFKSQYDRLKVLIDDDGRGNP